MNLNTKQEGKYLQVVRSIGRSVLPAEWDPRRNLPIDVHLATSMMHMQDELEFHLKEINWLTDEQVISAKEKGMFNTLLIEHIDRYINQKQTAYKTLLDTAPFLHESTREDHYKELLNMFQNNKLRLIDISGNTIDEQSFFCPKPQIQVKHQAVSPALQTVHFTNRPVQVINSETCLVDPYDIEKYGPMKFIDFVDHVKNKKLNSEKISDGASYSTLSSIFSDFDSEITVNELNDDVFSNFFDYLMEERDLEPGGGAINNYKKWIKAVFHYSISKMSMDYNRKVLNIKSDIFDRNSEKVTRPYLSEDMLDIMLKHKFTADNKKLEYVRDLFYIQCYTSVSYADLKQLFKKVETKVINGDITRYSHVRRTKNSNEADIMLFDEVYNLLEKYKFNFEPISNGYLNILIKDVLQQVGFTFDFTQKRLNLRTRVETEVTRPFYSFIGTHSGRRSYITNMKKRGMADDNIMSQSQHKSKKAYDLYVQDSVEIGLENFVKELRKK